MKKEYPGWELEYFDLATNFRNYQFKLIKNQIKGDVAEVGPGNGIITKKYSSLVKKISLYEPSQQIFKKLKKKFTKNKRITIHNSQLRLIKNKFDTIIYLDVIEHIKKDKEEINKALKCLKKDGVLIINVPAFSFLYSNFDKEVGHHKRYNKNDFKKMLQFTKIKKSYMLYYDSLGFLLSLLNKFFNQNEGRLFKNKILIWNFLINFSKYIDIITFHTIGKSLLIFIKK
jgi:2-polyprenyl-3-methyl-5-hydroxy-6-metoxy-1,4-benzoquinol methylase